MSGNHCALTMELQLEIQTLSRITTKNKPPCPDNEIIRQQQKNTTISINTNTTSSCWASPTSLAPTPGTTPPPAAGHPQQSWRGSSSAGFAAPAAVCSAPWPKSISICEDHNHFPCVKRNLRIVLPMFEFRAAKEVV